MPRDLPVHPGSVRTRPDLLGGHAAPTGVWSRSHRPVGRTQWPTSLNGAGAAAGPVASRALGRSQVADPAAGRDRPPRPQGVPQTAPTGADDSVYVLGTF